MSVFPPKDWCEVPEVDPIEDYELVPECCFKETEPPIQDAPTEIPIPEIPVFPGCKMEINTKIITEGDPEWEDWMATDGYFEVKYDDDIEDYDRKSPCEHRMDMKIAFPKGGGISEVIVENCEATAGQFIQQINAETQQDGSVLVIRCEKDCIRL